MSSKIKYFLCHCDKKITQLQVMTLCPGGGVAQLIEVPG